jgi:hypothetical protein
LRKVGNAIVDSKNPNTGCPRGSRTLTARYFLPAAYRWAPDADSAGNRTGAGEFACVNQGIQPARKSTHVGCVASTPAVPEQRDVRMEVMDNRHDFIVHRRSGGRSSGSHGASSTAMTLGPVRAARAGACTSAAPCRRILGGKRWLGGRCCQGRQPPKAGAAGPPLQDLPPSPTRPPRSTAGNNSAGCLKTRPQYTST